MPKLTARQVQTLTKPGKHYDENGLYLLIKEPNGRSWNLKVTHEGKERHIGLGSAKTLTLAQAREKAAEFRRLIKQGIDPKADEKERRRKRAETPTFRQAAIDCHAENKLAWRNSKHQSQWLSTLQTYAFPHIGDQLVDQIDGPAVRELLAEIWLTIPETARRVRQRVGAVLDWAYSKGYRQAEAPMRSVTKGLPKQPRRDHHFESMPYADVPPFMQKLGERDSFGRLALQFLILTAARSGEVRLATWQEVDLDARIWTIPAERMKAKKEHKVPLSDAAIAVLAKAGEAGRNANDIIFPGNGNSAAVPERRADGTVALPAMSDMTLTKALRDNWSGKATVHGFRSSFRDWAAERTDVAGEIVETALAHTIPNRVEAAYRRTNYLEKRVSLMESWATFLGRPSSPANDTDDDEGRAAA